MSEDECLEFIENEIEIPDGFPEPGAFVKSVIERVEDNPNVPFAINYNVTLNFAEDIRTLVNEYYGTAQRRSAATRSAYRLLHNWVFTNSGNWGDSDGYWDELWWEYNCYAYSIDRTELPSQYSTGFQYQPGDFAHTGYFNYNISINDLAMVVKDDLDFLGYDVYVTDTAPDPVTLEPYEKLICIRRGVSDYHFMKYNASDRYWYHKPGHTAPLRYRHLPSDYIWTSEISLRGIEELGGHIYDSDIYYIVYTDVDADIGTVIGSYDIYFDQDDLFYNGASRMSRRAYGSGNIGKFKLYSSGIWTITAATEDQAYCYFLDPLDLTNHSFFDALQWNEGQNPGNITSFLTQENMKAIIPLTVEFPMNDQNSGPILVSYPMEIEISGSGITQIWSGNNLDVVQDWIYGQPNDIRACPVYGFIEADN